MYMYMYMYMFMCMYMYKKKKIVHKTGIKNIILGSLTRYIFLDD